MAPIPTRIPPPEGMPTREESRRELELVLARGRIAAAKKAEAREVNRPQQPHPGTGYVRPLDHFQLAAERMALEHAIGEEIEREHAARLAAIKKHFAEKRAHIRLMARARAALGEERWREVEAVWRRRKQQQR